MNEDALPELPDGWAWAKLNEISKVGQGGTPTTKKKEYWNGNVPWLRSGEIRFNRITKAEEAISELGLQNSAAKLLPMGTVLLAMTGEGLTRGRAAILDVEASANQSCTHMIPDKSLLISEYLFYYFKKEYWNIRQIKKGSNQPGLNTTVIKGFDIPLSPLPEQRRIVAKIEELFTKLDAGVDALKKTQAQLKRYRQSVLKAACEGKLVPTEAELATAEGRTFEPANVLLARILRERRAALGAKYKEPAAPDANGVPRLPEGWVWANVGQMTDSMKNGIYKPSEFYTEDGFACLRMYNIDQGKIVWKDIKRMNLTKEEVDEYLLVPGDILVNRVNSRELVGKAAVIPSGIEKCVFESKNIRVRVIDEIVNPHYLCYRFSSAGTEYFNRNAQQVVGMASISQPQIARFPVPLPPLAEQHRIVAEVERCLSVADEVAKTVEQGLKQAERLRQSILKRAFEGKLVPQDPSDEPADRLLERIKAERARGEIGTKTRGRRKLNATINRVLI